MNTLRYVPFYKISNIFEITVSPKEAMNYVLTIYEREFLLTNIFR